MERPLLTIGHRGAAGHAPENTLGSVAQAIELGVDMVEVDVQRTSTGELVVLHDRRVDRTTNGTGYVSEMTLDEVRRLEAGSGQKVPLLEEVLAAANRRAGILVELKQQGIAEQVVASVRAARFSGPVIYASFLHAELLAIREIDGSASTLALLEGVPIDHISFAIEAKATHVGLAFDSTDERLVKDLQATGRQVFVYTVNDPRDIKQAISWGVDGIISDRPERVLRELPEHR